jgi:hypothetical protein
MDRKPIISLLTDFGTADGYVGTMKGVMAGIAPDATFVDLSHLIEPQNVRQAAYVLFTAYEFFPSHAVHLVVVDPGVGSQRRAIAMTTDVGLFVGPDNGVFSLVAAVEDVRSVHALTNPRYQLTNVSHTFHGRDVFAPAAAYLAAGVAIAKLGPSVADPIFFDPPRMTVQGRLLRGEVLHADHFGNCITSVGRLTWDGEELLLAPAWGEAPAGLRVSAGDAVVTVGERRLAGIKRTYAEVGIGEPLALVGSEGFLEIAIRQGNGSEGLGISPGDAVTVHVN